MARAVAQKIGLVCCLLAMHMAAHSAHAKNDPAVTGIRSERSGELLVCRLATTGLPGPKILSTLRSGLESAVEIHLQLSGIESRLDESRSYEFRLSFDLWEEVYTVYAGSEAVRIADLEGLNGYLADLPPLAVARVADLKSNEKYVVTAGLKLHPLAPTARGKMQEMVSGEDPASRASGDSGQEVSISLGRLIRFFYRGGSAGRDLVGTFRSTPFTTRELDDASH
jgi:hypothetical protein